MDAYSKVGLDECEQSLVGDGKKSTSGDVLCQAAYHALKVRGAIEGNESWRADNIEVRRITLIRKSTDSAGSTGHGRQTPRKSIDSHACVLAGPFINQKCLSV